MTTKKHQRKQDQSKPERKHRCQQDSWEYSISWNVRSFNKLWGTRWVAAQDIKTEVEPTLALYCCAWKYILKALLEDTQRFISYVKAERFEESFLVQQNKEKTMWCPVASSRSITISFIPNLFNIAVIRLYARTAGHSDDEMEDLYKWLQSLIVQTEENDIFTVHRETGMSRK